MGVVTKQRKNFVELKQQISVKSEAYEDEKGWLHVKTGAIANLRELAEQL